jgi:hypothetical protein
MNIHTDDAEPVVSGEKRLSILVPKARLGPLAMNVCVERSKFDCLAGRLRIKPSHNPNIRAETLRLGPDKNRKNPTKANPTEPLKICKEDIRVEIRYFRSRIQGMHSSLAF